MKIRILLTLSIAALVSAIFANLLELPANADRVASTVAAKNVIAPDANTPKSDELRPDAVSNAVTFIPVNPAATYLRTNDDPNSQSASPIALSSLGVAPGDTIRLNFRGRFIYAGCPDCYSASMIGVFSSSNTITGPENLNRIPGAIASNGPPISTMPTASGGVPTDIPEDFSVHGQEDPIFVRVPTGANYLFVSAHDSYFGDNSVAPGEAFGLEIERPAPSKIVFSRADGEAIINGIHIMDPDGTNQLRLTGPSSVYYDTNPKLSPDGTKVVFVRGLRAGSPDDWQIYVMNSDGTNVTQLTAGTNFNDFNPEWSPDGSKIVFRRSEWDLSTGKGIVEGLYLMNSDGSGQVPLFTRAGHSSAVFADEPAWSPDGSKIAFTHDPDGADGIRAGVSTINSNGNNPIRLTPENIDCQSPTWSPNNVKIAYVCQTGLSQIFLMNADGSSQRRLTNSSTHDNKPVWSPLGDRIAFGRQFAGIVLIRPDGSNEEQITFVSGDNYPDWGAEASGASISGRVFDATGTVGISGVTISLSGTSSGQRITDATGSYSFTNLTEGGDYSVSAAMGGYQFQPLQHVFTDLIGNATGNFFTPSTYDLTIESFEPVQAVYYPAGQPVQLIKDKATAAKIGVRVSDLQKFNQHQGSQSVALQITAPGQTIPTFSCSRTDFVPDQTGPAATCTKHFQLPSPTTVGSTDYVLNISVPGGIESNTSNNQAVRAAIVTDTGNLNIRYVTLSSKGVGPFRPYPLPPNTIMTMSKSDAFIRQAYPLSEANGLTSSLHPGVLIGSLIPGDFGTKFDMFSLDAIANDAGADRAVGVVHRDYFAGYHRLSVLGLALRSESGQPASRGTLVVSSGDYVTAQNRVVRHNKEGHVTAHEVGHTFGLRNGLEEYKSTATRNLRVNGFSPSTGSAGTSITQAVCFMNYELWPEVPSWIDLDDYDLLRRNLINRPVIPPNPRLREPAIDITRPRDLIENLGDLTSPFADSRADYLMIGAFVSHGRVVQQLPWYFTPNPSGPIPDSSSYSIRLFNSRGDQIYETPANVGYTATELESGNLDGALGLLSTKVPVFDDLAIVEIRSKGVVIDRITVVSKLLRDAVNGVPADGFILPSEKARSVLMELMSLVDIDVAAGDYANAIRTLQEEIMPLCERYIKTGGYEATYLEYEKHEVRNAIRRVTDMLTKMLESDSPQSILIPKGAIR